MMSLPSSTCRTVDSSPFFSAARFSVTISSDRFLIVRTMYFMRCTRPLGIASTSIPPIRGGSFPPRTQNGIAIIRMTDRALSAALKTKILLVIHRQ